MAYLPAHRSTGDSVRMLQPIAQSDTRQAPKLLMEFALVPRWRVPPEVELQVELHQIASVKDAGPERVHVVSLLCQSTARGVSIKEVLEAPNCARDFMSGGPVAYRAFELMNIAAAGQRLDRRDQ